MKKTTAILVMVFALSLGTTVNANNVVNPKTSSPDISKAIGKTSPFCLAIVKGDFDLVKKMVSLGERLDKKSNGMLPVHFAARYNKVEILKFLVENGADLDRNCDKGYSVEDHAKLSVAKDVITYLDSL